MKKLLYIVSDDWYFCSHRLSTARAAQAAGYEVVVATNVSQKGEQITQQGFRLIDLSYQRGSGFWGDVRLIRTIMRILKNESFDVLHVIAVRMVFSVGIAAFFTKAPKRIYAIMGLGHLFAATTLKWKMVRVVIVPLLRRMFRESGVAVIVQNQDDFAVIAGKMCHPSKVRLIRGSGVDIKEFCYQPEIQTDKPLVVLVSRLLRSKGIIEFCQAAELLEQKGVSCRMILVGDPDLGNPNSVQEAELSDYVNRGMIEWWGRRADIAKIWQAAHIAVLPSYYGEGIPKALIEAAACGRAIVTTDMPGCREIVQEEVNGILVPPRTVEPLANAIQRLVENPDLRVKMGRKGCEWVEQCFSSAIIDQQVLAEYAKLETL